ncbi:hypothetical protein ACSYAD_22130 [Acaryochloris marina NIES-2412]
MKQLLGSLAIFSTLVSSLGGFGTEAFAQSNRSVPNRRTVHR